MPFRSFVNTIEFHEVDLIPRFVDRTTSNKLDLEMVKTILILGNITVVIFGSFVGHSYTNSDASWIFLINGNALANSSVARSCQALKNLSIFSNKYFF